MVSFDNRTGKWRAYYFDESGKRRGRSFSKRADALKLERKKAEEWERIKNGLESPDSGYVFLDYAKHYIRTRLRDPHIQPSTIAAEEQRLRHHILPYFGNRGISTISSNEWKDHLDQLETERKLSVATRNRVRALLHTLYQYALRDGKVVFNPISKIPLKTKEERQQKKAAKWLSSEEVSLYLQAAKHEGEAFYMFALIMLTTGLRPSEAIALKRADVDLARKVIFVRRTYQRVTKKVKDRPKSGSNRIVPIHKSILAELTNYMIKSPFRNPEHPLIYRERGQHLSVYTIRDQHERTIKRAQVTRISPHQLRHTFATLYRKQGGSRDDLREILGHSATMVTDIYTHMDEDFVSRLTDHMDFGLTSNSGNVVKIEVGVHTKCTPKK